MSTRRHRCDGNCADSLKKVESLDVNGLKKMVLSLEKKINRNTEMRFKYPKEPERSLLKPFRCNVPDFSIQKSTCTWS
jgi:hypothetical protein